MIGGILIAFGPALIAVLILIFSAARSKTRFRAAVWGGVAALLMIVELIFLGLMADFNGAFSGSTSYQLTKAAAAFFIFCLLVYFVVTGIKFNRR